MDRWIGKCIRPGLFRYHETPLLSATKRAPGCALVVSDILLPGLCGGLLITVLKLTEYRFLILEHSVELYGALMAAIFAAWASGWD